VWDLATGKQIFLVRGFRSSWWTPDGKLLAEFTSTDKEHPAVIGELTPEPRLAKNMTYKLPEQAHLENNHLIEWKSKNKKVWTLTAYSPADLAVKWTRQFPEGRPGYTINYGDTELIFSDLLQSSAAKEKLRSNPILKEQADAIKQKPAGRLIEIVNAEDGAVRAQIVVEVPLTYEGVDGFNRVGDLLYLSTGDNRTIVYSLKTGVQVRQLYGSVVAADTASQIICTYNRRNETTVSDKTGAELLHLTLDSPSALPSSATTESRSQFGGLHQRLLDMLVPLFGDRHSNELVRGASLRAAEPAIADGLLDRLEARDISDLKSPG
jgi:hypothetical protein